MNNENSTRITLKRVRPNPLFQEWLEELYEEAKQSKSKLEFMLKEALDSLSKYPLPLQSGSECVLLKGFDKKLCSFLDKRLEVHKYNLGLSEVHASNTKENFISSLNINQNINNVNKHYQDNICDVNTKSTTNYDTVSNPEAISEDRVISSLTNANNHVPSINSISKSRGKKYKPVHRSGGYAILLALLEATMELPSKSSLNKENIIEKAQKYSEESFVRPKPDSFYTAWSNMSKLIAKGLVTKIRIKKIEYSLTEDGLNLAKELLEDSKNIPTVNNIIFNDAPSASSSIEEKVIDNIINEEFTAIPQKTNTFVEMMANSFDIILLIDKNETGGVSKKNDPTVAQFNKFPDLNHEYRSLKVGDFTWIAQHKTNKDLELVLPYVVERKRMDDLGASIKDGRFHEQKFRLRKCGLKNIIYLVENYGSNKHVGLPIQNLMQALANTRVQDGFKVHITDSLTNSARFLAMMTKRLTIRFKDKHLKGCNNHASNEFLMTFDYFNQASVKNKSLTVTESFIKLLLQLKGLSVEKALAITAKYNTPRSLIIAYKKCSQTEGEYLLANLKYGQGRNVGPAVSKSIYQLFSS